MIQVKMYVAILILVSSIAGSAVITHIVTRYSVSVSCATAEPAAPTRRFPVGPTVNSNDGKAF